MKFLAVILSNFHSYIRLIVFLLSRVLNFVLLYAAETWPFIVTLLIDCTNKEISASKRRLPKLTYAKTLRILVQRAQDSRGHGMVMYASKNFHVFSVWFKFDDHVYFMP